MCKRIIIIGSFDVLSQVSIFRRAVDHKICRRTESVSDLSIPRKSHKINILIISLPYDGSTTRVRAVYRSWHYFTRCAIVDAHCDIITNLRAFPTRFHDSFTYHIVTIALDIILV